MKDEAAFWPVMKNWTSRDRVLLCYVTNAVFSNLKYDSQSLHGCQLNQGPTGEKKAGRVIYCSSGDDTSDI